jgi:hypothetical protein
MRPRRIASTVNLSETGLGDLLIELAEDGALTLVRRTHSGLFVAALAVDASELSGLSDIAGLARIELNTPPASARALGPSRFDPDGRAAR